MSEDLLLPLAAVREPRQGGGKAASLAALLRAGFPVPRAVVLTIAAHQLFLSENGLSDAIAACLSGIASGAEERRAASAISRLIRESRLPASLEAALRTRVATLVPGISWPVLAVRSSALAEDLAEASFAGQMETRLGVVGEAAVGQAILEGWASLWSPRALAYRRTRGAESEPRMALLLQVLVPARAAGVLLTAEPVSGERGLAVLEGVWGFGKTLVDGVAIPDRWLLDKRSGTVRSHAAGDQASALTLAGGELREAEVPAGWRGRPVLDASQVAAVLALGTAIEALNGAPQDIEWVLDEEGGLHLLQARPLTALPPL